MHRPGIVNELKCSARPRACGGHGCESQSNQSNCPRQKNPHEAEGVPPNLKTARGVSFIEGLQA